MINRVYSDYRKEDVENCISQIGVRPYDIMIAGATGAGKSTTLNTLFGGSIASVGRGTDPETMDISCHNFGNNMRFWDTPGLGDSPENDKHHIQKIDEALNRTYGNAGQYGFIDEALIIIDGSNRDMNTAAKVVNVLKKHLDPCRILIAVNQADFAMKGTHWNSRSCKPDEILINFLEEKVRSVRSRLCESTGVNLNEPVYYSAEYDYNVEALLDMIIDNLPMKKRKV